MRTTDLNPIKKHLLNRELITLEFKVARHYVLSGRKIELETSQTNAVKKILNHFEYNRLVPEYELLSEQLPRIESRINEIKEKLRRN